METINTVIVRHNYYKTETYEHYYIRQQRRIQSANMKSITRFCSQAFLPQEFQLIAVGLKMSAVR